MKEMEILICIMLVDVRYQTLICLWQAKYPRNYLYVLIDTHITTCHVYDVGGKKEKELKNFSVLDLSSCQQVDECIGNHRGLYKE